MIKIYIGQHASHSNDKESVQGLQEHLSSSGHNIKIFCCNRTFSKKKPAALGESALSWSNSVNMFASTDYSIA
jgi:hypothetical protein